MVSEEKDEITELRSADVFMVDFVPKGSQQMGEQGFTVVKADSDNEQSNKEGDDSVTDEKEAVKVDELSEDTKKELLNKLKDEFDVETQMKMFLEDEKVTEKLEEKFSTDKEEEDEEEETEKEQSISPKSREALKTALDKLSKVKDEIPPNYTWVYKAIANLIDETAPEFEKSGEFSTELSEKAKDAVNKSLEQFEKEDELPDTANVIKTALEGMVVEKEEKEEKEEISKEAQEQIEKYKKELEDIKKEKMELEKEKIKKELTEKAETLKNIPESTEKLTELYAELYNADEEIFEKVENLLKKVDKQSEVGELFKEKGTQGSNKKTNESAEEKLDRLVKEKLEKGEAENESKAMEKALEENAELYEELRGH